MLSEHRLLGHYSLMSRIGSGGMGEVYLAEDTRINRQVAIKVVRAETETHLDPIAVQGSIRRLQREMRAITMLDHPYILPLFDFGEEKDGNTILIYMVMPYRQEGSFADWLQNRGNSGKLTPNEAAHFVMQAADALQHVHDHHLVHQDVKPANFLVRGRAGNGLPDLLLMDFGIAKITTATATASQNICGTPAFMAPEQWEGQPQPATDQYALAVMAYLLLAGRTPFSGRMEQVMHQHFTVQPQPASSLNPAISPALDAVILRGLEKEPGKRFPSILEFAHAFQQALQPASVPLLSTIYAAKIPEFVSQPSPNLVTSKKIGSTGKFRLFLASFVALLVIISSVIGVGISVNNQNQMHVSATSTAYAGVTARANPYPSYLSGSGKLAFVDPLSQPDNHWGNHLDSSYGGAAQFTQGAYHISEARLNHTYASYASDDFSNFAFEAQMTITNGDCGGILFRYDSTTGRSYFFEVCQNGSYALIFFRDRSANAAQILRNDSSVAIHSGYNQSNVIAVTANGNNIGLYVNGKEVDSVDDAVYSPGQIALEAVDHSDSTEVIYSNARVWTL